MVQWLGLHAFTAKGLGSNPDQGTKVLHAMQRSQKTFPPAKNKQKTPQIFVEVTPGKRSFVRCWYNNSQQP